MTDADPDARADAVELVVFSVEGTAFGVESGRVAEAVEYADSTRVPLTPDAVEGVAAVRGEVTAVLDAAAVLGEGGADAPPGDVPPGAAGDVFVEETATAGRDRLLVLDAGDAGGRVALRVEGVDGVETVGLSAIERDPHPGSLPAPVGEGVDPSLVAALADRPAGPLVVLDPGAVAALAE